MKIEDYTCREFLANEMVPRFEPIFKFHYLEDNYSTLYKINDFLKWFTPEMHDFIISFSVKLLKKKNISIINSDYGNPKPHPDIEFELSINNHANTNLELLIEKIKYLLENSSSILSVSGTSVYENNYRFFAFSNTYIGQKESMTFTDLCKWTIDLQASFPEFKIT